MGGSARRSAMRSQDRTARRWRARALVAAALTAPRARPRRRPAGASDGRPVRNVLPAGRPGPLQGAMWSGAGGGCVLWIASAWPEQTTILKFPWPHPGQTLRPLNYLYEPPF
jgi:hypothetical protein